jgi:uncharacterized membrane protein
MIRSGIGDASGFRWRSRESSRIEELTDAVIGFALTLLVISLEVPRTFDELMVTVRDFPGFAISFGILMVIWYEHYKFFRRYGIQNLAVIVLNAFLLFQIVFYMYPLKFLFILTTRALTSGNFLVSGPGDVLIPMIQQEQLQTLLYLFGTGWTAVWFTFSLMYWLAYREQEALRLNELEVFNTRLSAIENFIGACVGILSILIAYFGDMPESFSAASLIYLILFPIQWLILLRTKKQRQTLQARLVDEDPGPPA